MSTGVLIGLFAVVLTVLVAVGTACRQPGTTNPPPPPVTSTAATAPAPPSDPALRAKLLKRLDRNGPFADPATPRPLVTLEEFFEGNHDSASIGYNLPTPVEPPEFHDMLKQIRARPGVANVLVEVKDLEDPDGWPATDTVWIITSATKEEVRSWIPERIAPDDILDGFGGSQAKEVVAVPSGMHAWGIWWD